MFARIASLVVVAVVSSPVSADPPKKADPTADILAKLREPTNLAELGEPALRDFTFERLAAYLSDTFGISVVMNEEALKASGILTSHRLTPPRGKGLRLRTVLNAMLTQNGATFLVRKDHLEIVSLSDAARDLKLPADQPEFGPPILKQPIVSTIVKEKPLNEVLADIAEEFDLNVVVTPQAGDSRMAFVSVRLLNVPADKALETLAIAADLRVVRKGNVFLVTSRDHAKELFDEKLDKERQKIEVQKLREAPANPFGPLIPTAPPPAPKPEEKK